MKCTQKHLLVEPCTNTIKVLHVSSINEYILCKVELQHKRECTAKQSSKQRCKI